MIPTIQRPQSYGVQAYGAVKDITINARELQQLVFSRAIRALARIRQNGKGDLQDFHAVLADNRRLWTHVATQAATNPGLSLEKTRELLSLADFVFKHSFFVKTRGADITPLIKLNTEMRDGVRGQVFAPPSHNGRVIGEA